MKQYNNNITSLVKNKKEKMRRQMRRKKLEKQFTKTRFGKENKMELIELRQSSPSSQFKEDQSKQDL